VQFVTTLVLPRFLVSVKVHGDHTCLSGNLEVSEILLKAIAVSGKNVVMGQVSEKCLSLAAYLRKIE